MKTILLWLACLLPFLTFSQDDYCTCMEENNQYDEIMDFVQQINVEVNLTSSETSTQLFVPELSAPRGPILHITKTELIQKEEQQQPKEDLLEESREKKNYPLKIKKKNKRLKGKKKKSRKFKKYKGKCPFF